MLDTSDKAVFVSGYDPAMGTAGHTFNLSDTVAIVLPYDIHRRGFIVTNISDEIVYLSTAYPATPTSFQIRLRKNGVFAMDKFGGAVTAICDSGKTATLYVADLH